MKASRATEPKTSCPVCRSENLLAAIERESVPILQHLLYDDADAARQAPTARLAIRFCRDCGFGFNAAFTADGIHYDREYENDQSKSVVFSDHLDRMASTVLGLLAEEVEPTVVEIGCGQGEFLKKLLTRARRPIRKLFGFDPAFRGQVEPPIKIFAETFDGHALREHVGAIDAIVIRHVIEHVSDPVAFLKSIAENQDVADIFIETPSIEWILENNAIQDFFYEHSCYFNHSSLVRCVAEAGLRVLSVERVFGGQYFWLRAQSGSHPSPRPVLTHLALTDQLAANADATIGEWRARIEQLRSLGHRVALWGAGAKGVMFALLVDPERTLIDCLIDVNPRKQGRFVPVTAHPVVSVTCAAERDVHIAVVMNPNYWDEILALLRKKNLSLSLLSIENLAK